MIYNILCKYKEYRKNNGVWDLFKESESCVDERFIKNMLESGYYFTSMGGTQDVKMKRNRRFGMQVNSITCISFCGSVKKEFVFNYNNAKRLVQYEL